jgi:opacity protein-like surface antigen
MRLVANVKRRRTKALSFMKCMGALCFLCAVGGFLSAGDGQADVIRMKNGQIFVGEVVTTNAGGVMLEAHGRKFTVDQADILKTEEDISALKELPVEIILKDGSVIKGIVSDYDEEVGFLVAVELGSLTIPSGSVRQLEDPEQRNYFNGYPFQIGLTGGYSFTAGNLSSAFEGKFTGSLFAEFKTNLVRGLFAGIETSYYALDYTVNDNLDYWVLSAIPYASYRVLALRSLSSFLRNFVPYASAGVGLAYVSASDNRDGVYPQKFGELNFAFSAGAGLDYFVTKRAFIRVKGGWILIPQESSGLNLISVSAGGAYCF